MRKLEETKGPMYQTKIEPFFMRSNHSLYNSTQFSLIQSYSILIWSNLTLIKHESNFNPASIGPLHIKPQLTRLHQTIYTTNHTSPPLFQHNAHISTSNKHLIAPITSDFYIEIYLNLRTPTWFWFPQ